MAIDARLIGIWTHPKNGRGQWILDPQSADGLFYLIPGPLGEPYALPDSNTLLYPSAPQPDKRQWMRVAPPPGTSIVGHWRHESIHADDDGQDLTCSADGTFESFVDGDATRYSGTYAVLQVPTGNRIVMNSYRGRWQTSGNTYTATAFNGSTENGTFAFDSNPAGKTTVVFSVSPQDIWTRE